jgi:hypothetical protein
MIDRSVICPRHRLPMNKRIQLGEMELHKCADDGCPLRWEPSRRILLVLEASSDEETSGSIHNRDD